MKIVALVPLFDERENVTPLVRRISAALSSIPGCESELLFVVDGRDGTREALESLTLEFPGIRILHQADRGGFGRALRRGIAMIGTDIDFVVTLDGDLNHDPEEIPRLLETLRLGDAGIVVGSRFIPGGRIEGLPHWKRAIGRTVNALMRYWPGLKTIDKTSGFRVYRASVLRELPFRSDHFACQPEILMLAQRRGVRIVETPIHFRRRIGGRSKMGVLWTAASYLGFLARSSASFFSAKRKPF